MQGTQLLSEIKSKQGAPDSWTTRQSYAGALLNTCRVVLEISMGDDSLIATPRKDKREQ